MTISVAPAPGKHGPRGQKFFEFDKLSAEMKARIPAAKAEFEQVQRQNFEKELAQLKEQGAHSAEAEAALVNKYKLYQPNEYSKLFHRILCGDKALDKAPPRVFGYPSYELVEEGFSMVSEFGGYRKEGDFSYLVINGERWVLLAMNKAGEQLIRFEQYYRKHSERSESAKWDNYIQLDRLPSTTQKDPKELLLLLLSQQAAPPRFMVQDPNWGHYELTIGRAWMVGDLGLEADQIEELVKDPAGRFRAVSFASVNTNLKVDERNRDGVTDVEWVTLSLDSWLLSRNTKWKRGDPL